MLIVNKHNAKIVLIWYVKIAVYWEIIDFVWFVFYKTNKLRV